MTTADFTIADVLVWARTKPADEGYDFVSSRNCALAQFGRATGRMYLVGCSCIEPFVGKGPALTAFVLSSTFGELVGGLEKVVEPSFCKRAWARLTSKTIGGKMSPVSDTWTKPAAYLTDIEAVESVQA